ncbi:MAG: hypothetical protein ACK4X1_16975, partial [Terricaulis sp.]
RWTGRFMLRWRTLVLIAKSDIEGFPSLSDLDKPECPLSAKTRLEDGPETGASGVLRFSTRNPQRLSERQTNLGYRQKTVAVERLKPRLAMGYKVGGFWEISGRQFLKSQKMTLNQILLEPELPRVKGVLSR